MRKLDSICVFCGSKEGNDQKIIDVASELGHSLAKHDITLIYGAAKIGIMGLVAKATLSKNGNVIGIIPKFLKIKEVVHLGLSELIVTENMHERKMLMQDKSDGFITLPGGIGTFEELFEILTWLQLGLHSKPIGLLNVNHYYDDLILMMEKMVRKDFLAIENLELLIVDDQIDRLLGKMKNFKNPQKPK
ncbi:MAG: TIGR00730 family Rossman fold protein [Flavobacteriales bacterium]|nr:MAG: TIGR00730 family Rossman fold protein [Flavobacteriales bacterium]